MNMIHLDILFTNIHVWIPFFQNTHEYLLKILFYSLNQYLMSVLRYPDYVVLCLIRYMCLNFNLHPTIIPIPNQNKILGQTPFTVFVSTQTVNLSMEVINKNFYFAQMSPGLQVPFTWVMCSPLNCPPATQIPPATEHVGLGVGVASR